MAAVEVTVVGSFNPAFHKPIPMGTRVIVPKHYVGEEVKGEVIGVSFAHVIFTYMVLLDKPIPSPYGDGTIRGICVSGTELKGENGEDWRIHDLES